MSGLPSIEFRKCLTAAETMSTICGVSSLCVVKLSRKEGQQLELAKMMLI